MISDQKRIKIFWSVNAVIASLALIFLFYWLLVGQFHESTNDSYVNGNMITVTPQIDGIVTTILVDNTDLVEAGQPICEIDRHDFEIRFERAQGNLGETVRNVKGMFIQVERLKAKKAASEADLLRAELDYKHRQALVSDLSVSREDFEHSETALSAALARLSEVEQELLEALSKVANTTIQSHPLVEKAKADFRQAYLDLYRSTVRAPQRGIISLRKAQVGQWVKAQDPLMALIPLDQIWVDANFREVELKHLRIGQPVTLFSDMYGRRNKYSGKVVGLNGGTGSVFSVLPPQNATGNWIKIVQRVPVKIELDPTELAKRPLVLGLSMTTRVDTHKRTGLQLPNSSPQKPIYSSNVYSEELAGADCMINRIIQENGG